jgi:peptidoglycan/LPS O-acetylase OafA/YrhL
MKFLNAVLPNLTISLNLVLLIVMYLNSRNPMMGFLVGAPFLTLVACCFATSVASAATLYWVYRKNMRKKSRIPAENTKIDS